jgi:hypothetical protein
LRALERRAAELESEEDPEPFEQVEAEYARQCDAARQDAAREIQAIASDGDPRFADVLARGRELLGPQWPLANLTAVPVRAAARTA